MWKSGSDGHQPVVLGQAEPPREALGGHRVRAVRLGHELRAPGRARRGDEDGGVVVGRRGRGRRARRPPRTARPGSRRSRPASARPGRSCRPARPRSGAGRRPRRWRPGRRWRARGRRTEGRSGPWPARGRPSRPRAGSAPRRPSRSAREPRRTCRSRPRRGATACQGRRWQPPQRAVGWSRGPGGCGDLSGGATAASASCTVLRSRLKRSARNLASACCSCLQSFSTPARSCGTRCAGPPG